MQRLYEQMIGLILTGLNGIQGGLSISSRCTLSADVPTDGLLQMKMVYSNSHLG